MSGKHKQVQIQPNDLAELLKLKEEGEIDAAFKAASTLSSLLNYLNEGDTLSISGLTFYKSSSTSLEIINKLDKMDLIELISEGDV